MSVGIIEPVSMIQFRSHLVSSTTKKFFFHKVNKPPDDPTEGLITESMSLTSQIDFMIFRLIDSKLKIVKLRVTFNH